ncbi:MAG: ferrous iron transport protein B [Peptostreptococcaceae bacterium]|nr:ferrous iron transport protein B [Peptostreptococcaceae bacterium]
MDKQIKVALAGNPNSGKTTLFNELTGARHYVGNWPGVTVEKKEGRFEHGEENILLTDLPGIYSISPYTMEEIVTRKYIIDEKPDVILNIVDASNLERNLYLTIQLIEMGRPVIIALNMMDVVEKKGIGIDIDALSKRLNTPVIPITASKMGDKDRLLDAVVETAKSSYMYLPIEVDYGEDIEDRIEDTHSLIDHLACLNKFNHRWLSLRVIEEDLEIMNLMGKGQKAYLNPENRHGERYEELIVKKKYELINDIVDEILIDKERDMETVSDKIDKIVMNKYLGMPLFILIMLGVFAFTFDVVGNRLLTLVDVFFSDILANAVFGWLASAGVSDWLISLIVEGIIGGVGGILVFLPNIATLFFAISILEDSGYMARVAFIMDRTMRRIGLSGRAFIPMILGFGCNVPAIMSTRTLENRQDRMTAILINPFISCSARLPVYTLFASAFFPRSKVMVVFSLYFLGIAVAVMVAFVFKRTIFKSEPNPLLIELPPYRIPTAKGIGIHVWERVKEFIVKAGTLIFAASIVIWFLLNYNLGGPAAFADSFAASIGKLIAPIYAPLGFGNWRASLSLLTGIVAKEVIVSNMSIAYGAGAGSGVSLMEALSGSFTSLSAYSFMVYVLLYIPCIGVISVIKKETGSWKWTGFSVAYQLIIAWVISFGVYQIGSLFVG